MAKPPPPPRDVQSLLKSLHDAPIDNAGASDEILAKVYGYLMGVPQSPLDHNLHWFCDKAQATTIAAASFLLRLFAYDSPEVEKWKVRFNQCLRGCCSCVRSLEQVKVASRHTYFGVFSDDTLKSFYKTFERWELATIQREISSASASPSGIACDIQPATMYRALFNWTIFSDSWIQSVLPNCVGRLEDLPRDVAPPGTLLLLFHKDPRIRQLAQQQASKATFVPIPSDQFVGMYNEVLNPVVELMSSPSSVSRTSPALALCTDGSDQWKAFHTFLRHVPPELLKMKHHNADVRHVVVGHLHHNGSQFSEILNSLLLLLKRLGDNLWSDEGVEYPQVVFDAVKDNPAFAALLETHETAGEQSRYLAWFAEYLHTIRKLPAFGEVLAKMVDFLCEEMQHERFKVSRPVTMNTAMRLLNSILRQHHDEASSMVDAALRVVGIHSETIISVALSRTFNEEKWRDARISARGLVSSALLIDIEKVLFVVTQLCTLLTDATNNLPVRTSISKFSIGAQTWNKTYSTLQANDTEGFASIISTVARVAHIDKVSEKPFLLIFQISDDTTGHISPKDAFKAVSDAMETFSGGFLGAMTRFGDCNVSTSALDVLQRPGVAKDVMLLLLSPVEQIQAAAKSLISLAFDVDGRQECFRAFLEALPDAAFAGIIDFLNIYVQFAPTVPEACSLSSSLVRCFTDIIEVLCASPVGLLRNPGYLRIEDEHGPAARLPQLWTLMTKSLAVIFRRCPSWSMYFENEEMVLWMRDALIFGRDMLAQWRVIEKAASSLQVLATSTKPNRLSAVGKKMVNSLQELLPELARWLRLTDEELLHQSFSLIQFLLDIYRDTGVQPSTEGLSKLSKHLDNAKDKTKQTTTRLDASRLSALGDAIAYFDDEIEVVSVSVGSKEHVNVPKELRNELHRAAPSKAGNIQPKQNLGHDQKVSYSTSEDQRRLDAGAVASSLKKASGVPESSRTKIGEVKRDIKTRSQAPSSSESSDDESEVEWHEGGLADLAKFQKSPKIKKQATRRQIKTIEIAGVKNAVHERRERRDRQEDARRVALRLKPNLGALHKILLSWSYDHSGPMPPGEMLKPSSVPDTFKDYGEYRRAFEPLLLMECWAQICQAKDEPQEAYDIKVASKGYVDDWLDLDVSILTSVKKDWYLTETDVVLLRNAGVQKSIMAKIQSYRAIPSGIQVALRCYIKTDGDPGLHIGTIWQLSKIYSLSTIHREYAALASLPYYDFADMILRPKLVMPPTVNSKDVQNAMITYSINEPQAKAILSSLESSGFCLVQGPPGTGKTSTICGLVAVLLSRRRRPPTAVEVAKFSAQIDKSPASKILICAPSNAAIDEIAYRIKEGYRGSKRVPDNAKVVRIGTDKAINLSVKDISLNTLIDQKLNGNTAATKEKGLGNELIDVRRQLEDMKTTRNRVLNELKNLKDNLARYHALDEELKRVNSRRIALTQQLDRLKDERKSESRTLDAIRRKTRLEVLQEADVICATLSGAGHENLEQFDFETIVIDEAAQAIELSSLIPLRYKCTRCIMVGDPQQLPPTVISQVATRYSYNQSLFVRLQKRQPEAMQLLSIQYRMHPEISRLPSRLFYDNRLHDGPHMASKTQQPWHTHPKFGTYKFFDVRGTEEQSSRSLINKTECQVASALYARLRREFSSVNLDFRVGVVSMYRAQVVELRRHFERYLEERLEGKVDFNTVDGFQGQEKDIIILSCVRGSVNQDSVGFLADLRRMNVALTRAKSSLFILGNAATLERSNTTWAEIIADAKSRSRFIDVDATFFKAPSSSNPVPITRAVPSKAKTVTASIPVPNDLVVPKDFKASIDRIQAPPQVLPDEMVHMKGSAFHDSNAESGSSNKMGGGDLEPPPKTVRSLESSKPAPLPRPPLKRTKEPQSIFIPKKKQRP